VQVGPRHRRVRSHVTLAVIAVDVAVAGGVVVIGGVLSTSGLGSLAPAPFTVPPTANPDSSVAPPATPPGSPATPPAPQPRQRGGDDERTVGRTGIEAVKLGGRPARRGQPAAAVPTRSPDPEPAPDPMARTTTPRHPIGLPAGLPAVPTEPPAPAPAPDEPPAPDPVPAVPSAAAQPSTGRPPTLATPTLATPTLAAAAEPVARGSSPQPPPARRREATRQPPGPMLGAFTTAASTRWGPPRARSWASFSGADRARPTHRTWPAASEADPAGGGDLTARADPPTYDPRSSTPDDPAAAGGSRGSSPTATLDPPGGPPRTGRGLPQLRETIRAPRMT